MVIDAAFCRCLPVRHGLNSTLNEACGGIRLVLVLVGRLLVSEELLRHALVTNFLQKRSSGVFALLRKRPN